MAPNGQGPPEMSIPIPGACEQLTLHHERDFTGVIKIMDPKNGDTMLGYLGGSSLITETLKSRGLLDKRNEEGEIRETPSENPVAGSEMEG